jgi:hypothetical protein
MPSSPGKAASAFAKYSPQIRLATYRADASLSSCSRPAANEFHVIRVAREQDSRIATVPGLDPTRGQCESPVAMFTNNLQPLTSTSGADTARESPAMAAPEQHQRCSVPEQGSCQSQRTCVGPRSGRAGAGAQGDRVQMDQTQWGRSQRDRSQTDSKPGGPNPVGPNSIKTPFRRTDVRRNRPRGRSQKDRMHKDRPQPGARSFADANSPVAAFNSACRRASCSMVQWRYLAVRLHEFLVPLTVICSRGVSSGADTERRNQGSQRQFVAAPSPKGRASADGSPRRRQIKRDQHWTSVGQGRQTQSTRARRRTSAAAAPWKWRCHSARGDFRLAVGEDGLAFHRSAPLLVQNTRSLMSIGDMRHPLD